ncbi:MAG: FG-GAP repeat domain-containing protein [Bacteroidales bacterium]
MRLNQAFLIILICLVNLAGSSLSAQDPVSNWTYVEIDHDKSKWGDYDEPDWLRYFGLDMGDLNHDGMKDIVTGRWVYLNPGNDMSGPWQKVDLGANVDGILIMDVDGDENADLIAQALPDIYWMESANSEGTAWSTVRIGEVPATSHVNSQGFEKVQIIPGGKEEFVIAGEGNIYCFEIPEDPAGEKWNVTLIAANTSDEGIGTGDIDGDGDMDIVAGRRPAGGDEPLIVVWFENPGNGGGNWKAFEIGRTNHPADRLEVADLNGDGRTDIIVTEERYPGLEPDGNLFWYEQPALREDHWDRHGIVTQYSMNNLDIVDMDGDGDMDLITSEHKGVDLELQLWVNDGHGNFTEELLDQGKESHLGTQVADMDHDGDMDIVSIGWDQYQFVHLWRNESISSSTRSWRLVSSASGEIGVPNNGNQQTASLVADVDKDGDMDFFITERTAAPSVAMFRYDRGSWQRYIIDDEPLRIEAGSASEDIDGDGDLDIVFGGESQSNEVWWWENPYPNFNPGKPWNRYTIKKSGANKHHDQMFIDSDGDGRQELVFWNQGGHTLYIAEVPEQPRNVEEWPREVVYEYSIDSEMEPVVGLNGYPGWQSVNEHEGLAKVDMDGDGIVDIVGGGRWFKYEDGTFTENIIDASYTFSRCVAGQFIEGGRPEVVLVVGDGLGPMFLYQWHEWEGSQGNKNGTGTWERIRLIDGIDNGHTIDVIDFNRDGHLDIFSAEMRFGENNPDAKLRILLGDGTGHFKDMVIAEGFGVHEGRIADLDGDGDLDILGKPYTWKAPLLNIWINEGPQ